MSTLVVGVTGIEHVVPHPQADRLELAIVHGRPVCVVKGMFSAGDHVVFVPPETLVPTAVADALGVTSYLSFSSRNEGMGRVRAARLRGVVSHGFLFRDIKVGDVEFDASGHEVGHSVVELLGFEKYEPPVPDVLDAVSPHPDFPRYTGIEHYDYYSHLLEDGEDVVITEKIHGTNSRVGWLPKDDRFDGGYVCGSHNVQLKAEDRHKYFYPLKSEGVRALLDEVSGGMNPVALYGEIYGPGIGDFFYGVQNGVGYRVFDIWVSENGNGRFLDYGDLRALCACHGVDMVPLLKVGALDREELKTLASGDTTLCENGSPANIREGLVIRPVKDRRDLKEGRVILKFVSEDYLSRRGGSEQK